MNRRRNTAVAKAIAGAIELLRSGQPHQALQLLTPLPMALRDALRTAWGDGWVDGQAALAAEITGGTPADETVPPTRRQTAKHHLRSIQ
jgi:hypothetical protein